MQTFLPYSNFSECARVIDIKRLWRQILEANQLLKLITHREIESRWRNYPVYKMWLPYADVLNVYRDIFVQEWLDRRLIRPPAIASEAEGAYKYNNWPLWINNEKIFSSHRAALLVKNPQWYSQFGWKEKPEINYYWPIK